MSENVRSTAALRPSSARLSAQSTAIALLAEDALTDEQIAQQVGISARQLWRWKKTPAFAARLQAARERLDGAALREPIARKRNRMRELNAAWERLQRVQEDRASQYVTDLAQSPDPTPIPGAATGLLLPGTDRVDYALLRELRETMKQAAIEVGQWNEGAHAPLQINITLRNEAERLASKLGIPVEELWIEAEALLKDAIAEDGAG